LYELTLVLPKRNGRNVKVAIARNDTRRILDVSIPNNTRDGGNGGGDLNPWRRLKIEPLSA
jgi:hypothetical protein